MFAALLIKFNNLVKLKLTTTVLKTQIKQELHDPSVTITKKKDKYNKLADSEGALQSREAV